MPFVTLVYRPSIPNGDQTSASGPIHRGELLTLTDFQEIANFIWSIADDVLRDDFKRGRYPDVILPFTVQAPRIDVGTAMAYRRFRPYTMFKQRESVPLSAKGLCPLPSQAILVAPMGLPGCRTILVQGVRAGESVSTADLCLLARYTQWQS